MNHQSTSRIHTLNISIRANFVGFVNELSLAERLENTDFYQLVETEVRAINDIIAQNLNLNDHRLRYYVNMNPLKYSFFIMFAPFIAYAVIKIRALLYVGLALMAVFLLSCLIACVGQYKQVSFIYPIKRILDGPVQEYVRSRPNISLQVEDISFQIDDDDGDHFWKWSLRAELSFHLVFSS